MSTITAVGACTCLLNGRQHDGAEYFTKLICLMLNDHVADVKYLVVLLKVQVYLHSSLSLHDQPFSAYLGLSCSIFYHVKILKCLFLT